jgi:hypothetical protein
MKKLKLNKAFAKKTEEVELPYAVESLASEVKTISCVREWGV